ncbi:hypothetical protein P3T20_003213 [Paraburkholderia sp. GAS206C]|uniref:hypothetical protein n=1 Tax=unclassified Paraburkholderia TaxID=2615204 RepID=UPI003D1B928F
MIEAKGLFASGVAGILVGIFRLRISLPSVQRPRRAISTLPDCAGRAHRLVSVIENQSVVATMISRLSERENAIEHINAICLRLFDIWCQRRSTTALTYLLHCWPLMDSRPATVRRLHKTLSELRRTHLETIDAETEQALFELADWTDEILQDAPLPDRSLPLANRELVHAISG